MRASVTGSTGFFGQALLRVLMSRSEHTRALVRRPDAMDLVRSLGAEPVLGDLTDPEGCRDLVQPGDVVFHAAAHVDLKAPWADYERTTVEGTRHLLAQALPRNPSRIVYVSSASVYCPKHASAGPVSSERTPAIPDPTSLYSKAKLVAENLVREQCDRAGCEWTIVRLGFLYGPANQTYLRECADMIRARRFMVIGKGANRIATLYVDDAAEAVFRAADHPGGAGRIYDVANDEAVTQRAFLEATGDALGYPGPRPRVPYPWAYGFGWLTEKLSRLLNRPPDFNRAIIKLMSADQVVDSSRIREDTGWVPSVDFEEGMRRTRQWCLENGLGRHSTVASCSQGDVIQTA